MKLQILRKLIPIACLLVSMNVLAYDFKSGGIYYNITSTVDKTVKVTYKDTNYNSYSGEVTIPGSVTHEEIEYSVTSIGERAFSGCSGLTSVTIPNSVTQIGNYAFDNCIYLKDLKIEDGTEILELGYNYYSSYYSIGEGLFYDCPLETVYLGRNLSYNTNSKYGYSPFYNQKALKTITIGNSVTSIGDYALYNCSGLTSVTIPNSVTSIGEGAFVNCSGLTSITIPNSVTSVDNYAFNGCASLKDLKIEDGAKVLYLGYNNYYNTGTGKGLFYDCPLETVYLGRNLSYNTSFIYGYSPFYNQKALKAITIGNNVTSIGENAFYKCSVLTSVTIPNSVTSIGEDAFGGCSSLTKVVFKAENCTKMGSSSYSVFKDCTTLTDLTIGENVKIIPNYAFYNCSGLTSVTFESITPPSIGQNAFYNVDATFKVPFTSIFAYKAIAELKDKTFGGFEVDGIYYLLTSDMEVEVTFKDKNYKSYTGEVVIPSEITVDEKKYNVTSIGENAFTNCSGLTSVTITNSVTTIGYYAFVNCSGLTSITIPNSVTSVGSYAFNGCTSLKDLKIEDGTEILELGHNSAGKGLFYDCPLETVCLGRNLNYNTSSGYGYSPFYNQKALKTITIGNSVTSIGYYAFLYCSGLTSVTIPNSVTSIGGSAFSGCSGLTSVTIPNSVTSIGHHAFSGCSGLTSITIPNSVTSIGHHAFDGCSGLTSITIPNSVTQIGNYAFGDCTSLKDLKIEDGTEILELGYNNCSSGTGEGLFYDCPLETVYLGRNLSYNTSYNYGYSPFYNQKALKAITIGNSVTSIGDYAFYNCSGLTSVIIGNSVTSISSSAFSRCYIKKAIWLTNTPPQGYANLSSAVHYVANKQYTSLNNVTIYPYLSSLFEVDGIKYVPVSPSERTCDAIDCAYDTTATNINIENTVSYKGVAMTLKEIKPYTCNTNDYIKQVKINFSGSIDKEAFSGCTAITSAEIKASIIDKEAFYGCSSLETITVNAKSLGTSAFASCATKESAIFEISVQTIGDNSFKGCTKVESITLSDNLISIGDNAFERCSNLKELVIPDAVKSLGGYAFSGCSSLEDITIGASVATIKESAFSGCSKLPEITIPSNVTSIGDYVFNNCTSLATVVINDRDTDLSFGSNDSNPLFYSCPLDSVYIGGNITYPTSGNEGYSPFYRNTNLRSVVITDKETEISENEFYGCSNLKNISIGDGVETIGKWAFSGCSSLDYFAFGSGMKTIGEEAFSDCTAMTKLISRTTTPPTCGTQALDDINKWVCELFVPQSAVTAYQGANQWKEFFFITGTESSGVESTLTDEVDVSVENGNIVIKGADNAMIEVYSLNGQCVYSGIETTISIAAKGLYVVKVNGKSFKVMM